MSHTLRVLEYLDAAGQSPFARWFAQLNPTAAAKVTMGLYRLEHGNFSNVKGVGGGVFEYKIDFGPGYRIYFGKDGDQIIILLGDSEKKRQAVAIGNAQNAWRYTRSGSLNRIRVRDDGSNERFQKHDVCTSAARCRIPQSAANRGAECLPER